MYTTTTYARRHRQHRQHDSRRGAYEGAIDPPETEPREQSSNNHLKRKRPGQKLEKDPGIEPPRKKKAPIIVDNNANEMSIYPFQTPFPTLQTQSQVFKLPSSSPKHSPGLLSPVPIVFHKPISGSKNLKENRFPREPTGNTKSWFQAHDLDKILSSATLRSSHFSPENASGPGLSDGSRSRTTSRSSSNSSVVSSTLKDSQGSKISTTLKHSKSLTSLKGHKKSKRRQEQKSGKLKQPTSTKSLNFPPLASPFASRSCSPVLASVDSHQKAHILANNIHPSNQSIDIEPHLNRNRGEQTNALDSKIRLGLSEISFHPNLPDSRKGLKYSSQSSKHSPQKEETIKSATERLFPTLGKAHQSRKPKTTDDKQKHLLAKNRRPSAPSILQVPRTGRRIDLASLPRRQANNENPPSSASMHNGRIRLGSGLSIALAPSSPIRGHKGNNVSERMGLKSSKKVASHGRDSDAAMEWMHSRGGIDFNRPPSQMSFRAPFGFEYPEVEAPDVFFSSSSDEDDDNQLENDVADGPEKNLTRGRAPIVVGKAFFRSKSAFGLSDPPAMLNFGEDVRGVSSPFKPGMRHLGLDVGQKTSGNISNRLDLDNDRHRTNLGDGKKEMPEHNKKQASTLTRSISMPNFKNEEPSTSLPSISLKLELAEDVSTRQRRADIDRKEERSVIDADGEMDMELTGTEVVGGVHSISGDEKDQTHAVDERDWTPWVTDSIISPPTGYLGRVINKGDARVGDRHFTEDRDGAVGEYQRYILKDESSSSDYSDLRSQRLSSPFDLSGDVEKDNKKPTHGQEQSAFQSQSAPQPNVHATIASSEPETKAKALIEDTDLPANTTRTRSGTIVPIRAPIPPGIRRTRGGTIVGPLPSAAPTMALPSVPNGLSGSATDLNSSNGPELGRSGTVTAPAISQDENIGQLLQADSSATLEGDYFEEDIDCYVDSMYLPPLTSSPDPIDFLRFASIMEEDEEYYGSTEFQQLCDKGKEIVWQVAEDPPSPETAKKRGNKVFRGIGLGGMGWPFSNRADRKRKSQKKTRFVGDALGADGENDEEVGQNGDTELSDDELLLRDSGLP